VHLEPDVKQICLVRGLPRRPVPGVMHGRCPARALPMRAFAGRLSGPHNAVSKQSHLHLSLRSAEVSAGEQVLAGLHVSQSLARDITFAIVTWARHDAAGRRLQRSATL